jgi:transposase InsO family protein
MNIRLHKNARTTPAIRREIQQATGSDYELAERFGVTRDTIRKWRKRTTQEDYSHTAHRLQTTLNPAQEALVIELRKSLGLSLDDLLTVVREFIHASMSRSALDRLLRRHGVSKLPVAEPTARATQAFKAYEPGYLHIDVKYLPQMPDETQRRYLFVAIDRATRWVYTEIRPNKTAASARRFLKALHARCPVKIQYVLTDNGKEFTDRLFGARKREESGTHEFDLLCEALGIEHRLTKPKSPQTNGMAERFNGRISHVLNTHRFDSGEDLEQTLARYVWLYNHHVPQKALNHETPVQALKRWQSTHPELFVKQVRDRPGPDI